ncbi:MAG: hypothetical protein QXZ02_05455 [Candidatus Bathyarchaeia archaeon]
MKLLKPKLLAIEFLLLLAFVTIPKVCAEESQNRNSESEIVPFYALDNFQSSYAGNDSLVDNTVVDEDHEAYYSKYIIPLVVAADEEMQQISYWVGPLRYVGWRDAIINIVERADNYLWERYGIDFKIVGWRTWDSNNALTEADARLHELADELNWNPEIRGNTILVGFTEQKIIYGGEELWGASFNQSINSTQVCLIKPTAYWVDDNTLHHEITWNIAKGLSSVTCYDDDCVMSYNTTHVYIVWEDGYPFLVLNDVYVAMLTHHYCSTCEFYVLQEINRYKNFMYSRRSAGYWRLFPL